jgi:hypothetical protein
MYRIAWTWLIAVVVLCTAMPHGMAAYNYLCTPLPAPIVVERGAPLPDQLSPHARQHAGAMRDAFSERVEVIQFATTDVLILKYEIGKQSTHLIIVKLDGREHNFYM